MTLLMFINIISALLRQPRPRLLFACFGEKFHWSLADTHARKGEDFRLPARIADNSDFFEVALVTEEELRVAPRFGAFPAREALQDDQELDRTDGHFRHDVVLHRIELGFF